LLLSPLSLIDNNVMSVHEVEKSSRPKHVHALKDVGMSLGLFHNTRRSQRDVILSYCNNVVGYPSIICFLIEFILHSKCKFRNSQFYYIHIIQSIFSKTFCNKNGIRLITYS
jgi:hypothetical protein